MRFLNCRCVLCCLCFQLLVLCVFALFLIVCGVWSFVSIAAMHAVVHCIIEIFWFTSLFCCNDRNPLNDDKNERARNNAAAATSAAETSAEEDVGVLMMRRISMTEISTMKNVFTLVCAFLLLFLCVFFCRCDRWLSDGLSPLCLFGGAILLVVCLSPLLVVCVFDFSAFFALSYSRISHLTCSLTCFACFDTYVLQSTHTQKGN